jgi:predicted permease
MSWFSRLRNSIRSDRISRELDEEMQFHIEKRAADLGLTPGEARRRFGNQLRLREDSWDVKAAAWPETWAQDFRFGLRMLRKNPLVIMAALLSLSLAIGSCTAVFSLVDALVLRPLPLPDPDSLVYLSYRDLDRTMEIDSFPYPLFEEMREAAKPFARLFGIGPQVQRPTIIEAPSEAETVRVQFVSGDSFSILGVRPLLGRLLAPADDRQPPPVAVLSYAFWARRFAKDPSVLGRWIKVEDQEAQIIGVAEERYTGTDVGISTDVWMPNMTWRGTREFTATGYNWLRVWGRLKPDAGPAQVRERLQGVFSNHRRERAAEFRVEESPAIVQRFRNTWLEVRPAAMGASALRKEFAKPLWILGSLVSLVLLIACANVANLLLARASSREREMAIRLAVGASRRRLIRQLMLESSLLALLSAFSGILLALWGTPLIMRLMAPSTAPAWLSLKPDWRVLGFLVGLSVLATVLFGLVPSLRASSTRPDAAMKCGDSRVVQLGFNRLLLVAQIGFCLAVLFVSGLFVLNFRRLLTSDMGFREDGLVLVNLLAAELRNQPAAAPAYWEEVRQRIRSIPGVTSVSFSTWPVMGPLLGESGGTDAVRVDGRPSQGEGVYVSAVSPEFFETMGVSILAGRGFAPRDTSSGQANVAVVNESFARRYFHRGNPVGRTFEHYASRDRLDRFEVVGLARDTKFRSSGDTAWPTVWTPLQPIDYVKVEIRTSLDPGAVRKILRQELPRIHSAFQIFSVTTAATILDDNMIRERLLATLSGFFAVLATILAAVGIYGVLNYAVARRTNEIGLRMALGANAGDAVWLVAREVMWMTVAGSVLGLVGSYVIQHFIAALLYAITPSEPLAVGGPIALLVVVVIVAAVPPAARASRVEPMTALRYE